MSEKIKKVESRKDKAKQALAMGALAVAIFGPGVYGSIGHTAEERQQHSQEAMGLMGTEALLGLEVAAAVKMKRLINERTSRDAAGNRDPYADK
jgi:hypothetical protein